MGAQDYLNLLKVTADKKLKKKTIKESPGDNAQILMETLASKAELLKAKIASGGLNLNKLIQKAEKELQDHLLRSGHSSALRDIHKHQVLRDKITSLKRLKAALITGGVVAGAVGINRLIKGRKAKDVEDRLKESVQEKAILHYLKDDINLVEFEEILEENKKDKRLKRLYDRLRTLKKKTKHVVKPLVRKTSAQWMLKHKKKINEQLLIENINDEIKDLEDKIHEKRFGFKTRRGSLNDVMPDPYKIDSLEKRLTSLKRLKAGLIGGGILAAGGLAYAGKKLYDKKQLKDKIKKTKEVWDK